MINDLLPQVIKSVDTLEARIAKLEQVTFQAMQSTAASLIDMDKRLNRTMDLVSEFGRKMEEKK